MLKIESPFTGRFAFLHTGFRPFFTAAALSAVVLMSLWLGMFSLGWWAAPANWPMITWHAYEMIFGFGVAVVAGFLLTAVRNWTHLQTASGYPLLGLALLWLLARLLPFLPFASIEAALGAECLFLLGLGIAITHPIVRTKQWNQMAVIAKVFLLLPALASIAVGLKGIWQPGIGVGLYAALYLLMGLLLTLGRRVMPMFIERGLNNGFFSRNHPQVDRWSMILFVGFAVTEVCVQMGPDAFLTATGTVLALVQTGLHGWRLRGWYHKDVWQKPMVWSLVAGYGFVILGFALRAISGLFDLNASAALHAFAAGGLGLVTLGMMSRVSLGHTGRNVNAPPPRLVWAFMLVSIAALMRSVGVMLLPDFYGFWIVSAQVLWMATFALFAALYLPIWLRARIDGGWG